MDDVRVRGMGKASCQKRVALSAVQDPPTPLEVRVGNVKYYWWGFDFYVCLCDCSNLIPDVRRPVKES